MLPEVLSGSLPDCDADSGPTPPTPPEVQALYEQIAGEARDTVGGRVPEANEDTSSNSSSSESESEHGSVMSRDDRSCPNGPDSYNGLFEWPAYNAKVLLSECESAAQNQQNLHFFLTHGVVCQDAYSGCGTASISGHQQLQSMHIHLETSVPGPFVLFPCTELCARVLKVSFPQFDVCLNTFDLSSRTFVKPVQRSGMSICMRFCMRARQGPANSAH